MYIFYIVAAAAFFYLLISYLPFLQLTFLQKYQQLLDINLILANYIYFTIPAVLLGLGFLLVINKLSKHSVGKSCKTAGRIIKLSTICVLIGLAASFLTLTTSMCTKFGLLNFIYNAEPWSPEEVERIAIHEAGHALMREIEFPGTTQRVEILPPSDILKAQTWFSQSLPSGYVMGEGNLRLPTKTEINKKIRVYLAGLTAEKIIYPENQVYISSSDDLQKVKDLVKMLCDNGLTYKGPVPWNILDDKEKNMLYQRIVESEQKEVYQILIKHKQQLMAIAEKLKEKRSLNGNEIRSIINKEEAKNL
ncbi:MAG: hypothetical protein H0Z40_00875 [Desulfotomaculum sp.]|nr:hypothetical protein [Desulfotomaculum sp.]